MKIDRGKIYSTIKKKKIIFILCEKFIYDKGGLKLFEGKLSFI